MRHTTVVLALASLLAAAEPAQNPAEVAKQQELQGRIAQLEDQIRGLVAEQANAAGPAGAAAAPDYTAAKARAALDVRRRLDAVEFMLADNDYARAVDTCNAILVDHPHEPATVRLKYRILMAMVERERALMERDRAYRADMASADGQARSVIPRDPPALKRTVWTFDEDVQAAERAVVQQRLKERVTLNYDGVVVGEVLKPLFAVAGINYVILDSALSTETLTLHLVDESIENALTTISKLVKIHYNYSGSTVYIGAEDSDVMVSEIIRLESGLTDVSTEQQLPEPAQGGGNGGAGGVVAGAAPMIPQLNRQGQGGQNGQNGQGSSDLEKFLDKVPDLVANWPADGRIYLDRKSNTVYVRSTPAAITELRRMLHAMDYLSAQVLIEARFVEVSEGAEKQLGIDWSGGGSNGRITLGGPMGGGVQTPASGLTFTDVTTPIGPAAIGGGGLNLGVLFSPSGMLGIKAAISALETEDKAEQLAEPRILTLNNAVGNIQLTQSVSYIKSYDYNNSTTNSTNNNGQVTNVAVSNPTPVWAQDYEGITLRIKPSIARNSDVVTLEILPAVRVLIARNATQINAQASTLTGQQTLTVENPDFRTRTLATTMHVQNGQTVVLGGLTQDQVSTSDSGVPGLRRMPFLGRLFSHKSDSMKRSNLLIFVTAHIIDPSGAKIGEQVQRLKDTATVLLPEEVRAAEASSRALEDQRRVDAVEAAKQAEEKAQSKPPSTKAGTR